MGTRAWEKCLDIMGPHVTFQRGKLGSLPECKNNKLLHPSNWLLKVDIEKIKPKVFFPVIFQAFIISLCYAVSRLHILDVIPDMSKNIMVRKLSCLTLCFLLKRMVR